MSSPYGVLGNRPLDQWKVVELREELKKRKLPTKGLKEDLVKRLGEAVRIELQSSTNDDDDDDDDNLSGTPPEHAEEEVLVSQKANDGALSDAPPEAAKEEALVSQKANDSAEVTVGSVENGAAIDETGTNVCLDSFSEAKDAEAVVVVETIVFTNEAVEPSDDSKQLSEVDMAKMPAASTLGSVLPGHGILNEEDMSSAPKMESDDILPESSHQVSGVDHDSGFQLTSNSLSTASVTIIEKNELKVEIITESNQSEIDVKAEIVQTSLSSDDAPDSMDVQNQLEDMDYAGTTKVIDTGDLGSEKLNLDRSPGDDSMEEDALDTKQFDVEPELDKGIGGLEKSHFPNPVEDENVDVVGHYNSIETEPTDTDKGTSSVSTSLKRKLPEPTSNNEPVKKAPRWNTAGLKSSEFQTGNDPADNNEAPMERAVPPSSKPPTDSLRIDRFLRPFTLKAVQELLGRTGTVTSFWMDHIKTHCYVSYSSVEEAENTRDAVYNLQWPPNGGRLLVAEFVDTQEVKARLDPSLPSPNQPQPTTLLKTTPHLPAQRQQQPPLSSFPPPFTGRERPHPLREPLAREQPLPARDQLNLPPPPPLSEKADPPVATLDDFFRKTKSNPRIYYLPLSDEQVAEKLRMPGKNAHH